MPCRGQHDTERGEHRGPQEPQSASGARRAWMGGSHGALIIALDPYPPDVRSGRFRYVRSRRKAGRRRPGRPTGGAPDGRPEAPRKAGRRSPGWPTGHIRTVIEGKNRKIIFVPNHPLIHRNLPPRIPRMGVLT
ncbi:hypothetical protein GCM10011578_025600 [Streptomyces fuscichromogenes]|uniref:Uncharacterized protein n=1 Tax=Streptomyces fuscichromogenes TaxID=1324013 RepID=A0A917XAX9_9ACTN|nr:hypothetical protein GCM10011578_025600 [Streptomyces fuscichromogenes]